MNSKISLFNKTIIKTDFKRFWWISALLMIVLALFVLPNVVQETPYYNGNYIESTKYYAVSDDGILVLFAGFFTGALLFSYLHKSNSVSAMHGIPISRTTQFISHYFVGAVLLAIPVIITTLIMAIELKNYDISMKYTLQYIYTSGVYGFVMLSLSAFSAMIAGNIVAAYVFEFGFIILPAFLYTMIDYLFRINLFGYVGNDNTFIDNLYIFGVKNMWSMNSLWLVAIAVIFLVASFLLYRIRQLEYFDEIVVFKALKYVFVIVVTGCFSMFSIYLFDQIYSIANIFTAIPLGIIALVATYMLNNKAVSFKGTLKPAIIYVICIAACYSIFKFDLTGFEHRVPAANNVESISISRYDGKNNNLMSPWVNDVYYDDITPDILVTSPDEIEKITGFHKDIVNFDETENTEYTYRLESVYFEYNLKNGSEITREYYVPLTLIDEYYNSYVSTDAYRMLNYPITNDGKKEITAVHYYGVGADDVYLSNIDKEALLKAVNTDIMSASPENIAAKYYNNIRSITIDYNEIREYNGKEIKFSCSQNLNLYDNFENTVKLINDELSKPDFTDKIINPQDITSLSIDYYVDKSDINIIKSESNDIEVSPNDAQEIFKSLYNIQSTNIYTDCYNISFNFKTTKGDYYINITYNYDSLPDIIKKYITH